MYGKDCCIKCYIFQCLGAVVMEEKRKNYRSKGTIHRGEANFAGVKNSADRGVSADRQLHHPGQEELLTAPAPHHGLGLPLPPGAPPPPPPNHPHRNPPPLLTHTFLTKLPAASCPSEKAHKALARDQGSDRMPNYYQCRPPPPSSPLPHKAADIIHGLASVNVNNNRVV